MKYRRLEYDHIQNESIRDIFRRCNVFLADVHSMIALLPREPGGPAGNWSIALVLFCVIDGLAKYIYPITPGQSATSRYKTFVADKILCDTTDRGARSANRIHKEFRGLLVHELAVDKREGIRDDTMAEPAVSKWEPFPPGEWDAELLEDRIYSGYVFPVFTVQPYEGRQREVLCTTALYGSLKQAVIELSQDDGVIDAATAAYPSLMVQSDSEE